MTEAKKPKTRAYQTRVEYLAAQTEVDEKLTAGYSRVMIYVFLKNSVRLGG